MKLLLVTLLFLVSCGPSSLEDYKEQGKMKTRQLLGELQKIQNRDQLLDAEDSLKACFRDLGELMLAVEKFRKGHPQAELPYLTFQDHDLSDQLRFEIIRICRFDGGKEIFDKIRSEGLNLVAN